MKEGWDGQIHEERRSPPSVLLLPLNIKGLLILPPGFPPASSPLSLLFAFLVLPPQAISVETLNEA